MDAEEYIGRAAKLLGVTTEELNLIQRANGRDYLITKGRVAEWQKDVDRYIFRLYVKPKGAILNRDTVTGFNLVPFPGCCAFMISTGAYVDYPYQNKGIGTLSTEFRESIAKDLGYTTLICTDVEHNTYQRKLLAKRGWSDVYKIRNKRTDNVVNISLKEL